MLHSWIRWAVIIAGLLVVFRAIAARSSGRAWNAGDKTSGRLYTTAMDVQVLVGLLYFCASPIVSAARQNIGVAMSNDVALLARRAPVRDDRRARAGAHRQCANAQSYVRPRGAWGACPSSTGFRCCR